MSVSKGVARRSTVIKRDEVASELGLLRLIGIAGHVEEEVRIAVFVLALIAEHDELRGTGISHAIQAEIHFPHVYVEPCAAAKTATVHASHPRTHRHAPHTPDS